MNKKEVARKISETLPAVCDLLSQKSELVDVLGLLAEQPRPEEEKKRKTTATRVNQGGRRPDRHGGKKKAGKGRPKKGLHNPLELPLRTLQDPSKLQEVWEKGNLQWKLYPWQKKVYRRIRKNQNNLFYLNISRRFGKTTILLLICIEDCLREEDTRINFASKTQRNLKKFVLPIIKKLLADSPRTLRPHYLRADNVLVFKNGSEIHFAGCDEGNEENLRGQYSNLNIIDEAATISNVDYVMRSILMPMTDTTGGTTILASTPSKTPDHDAKKIAEEAEAEGAYEHYTIYDRNPPQELLDKIIKDQGGVKSAAFRREYLCEWVIDEELAIIPEWRDKKAQLVGELPSTLETPLYFKYVAMDLGIKKDFTAALFAYYDFLRAAVYVQDEFVVKGPTVTTELLHRMIREKEDALWPVGKHTREGKSLIFRVADSDNPLLINDLNRLHGMDFAAIQKDKLEAMVNFVRQEINHGSVIIHPRCAQLIGSLDNGIWTEPSRKMPNYRREFARSRIYGHYDALAALVYLVRYVDRWSNPIPQNWRIDPDSMFLPGEKKTKELSTNALRFKSLFNK